MTYHVRLLRFFFAVKDHLFRIHQAEKVKNIWKWSTLLTLLGVLVYGWMAFLGMGTDLLSERAASMSPEEYEYSKLFFLVGRMLFALFFTVFILFIPSLVFYFITRIPYRKLLIMQLIVLLVMIAERITYVPLALFAGLDWYVSPLSFGIMVSYLTDIPWVIYFFGAASLFQLWIIVFQIKYLRYMSTGKGWWIWLGVGAWHVLGWGAAAFIAHAGKIYIGGMFG